jgi:high-affinity nickel-transport protein
MMIYSNDHTHRFPAHIVGLPWARRKIRIAQMSIRVVRLITAAVSRSAGTTALLGGLILANLAAWAWAFALFADRPVILGTALLAWVFGLRHAVDADHIAAIDNVVRKLMQAGDASRSVGLYFSLGHSTVVVVATAVLVAAAVRLKDAGPLKAVGSLIGTSVSAAFLLVVAATNLIVLAGLWRTFLAVRARGAGELANLDALLSGRGVLARVLSPLFRMVSQAWHMYPLGLLFGLGFDTATEIGLLSLSATEAARGLSAANVLVFPALFTAAMALVDTADSTLMVSAYRWAFVDPLRKLWYNLTITAASVLVAVFIGGIEAIGLIGQQLGLAGGLWKVIADLNDGLTNFGFVIIGLFALAWGVSVAIYRMSFDEMRPAGLLVDGRVRDDVNAA